MPQLMAISVFSLGRITGPVKCIRLVITAAHQVIENGPGRGLQAHNLIVMETENWLHTDTEYQNTFAPFKGK